MADPAVRRSLYVLFARLLAGAPDPSLYERLHNGGLKRLAAAQGVDLTSDLLDETDAVTAASELGVEWEHLSETVSLRASDYGGKAGDPVTALSAFLREHRLELDKATGLPPDHLAVTLAVMGELAGDADAALDEEAPVRARSFFLRHLEPWSQRALTELASHAQRRFYRGVAAMLSAFLETERRSYQSA